jgi:hypothetical protein
LFPIIRSDLSEFVLLSTQLFFFPPFNTLSVFERNTADDSRDYGATSNADREMFLKTVLFARWSYSLQITLRTNVYACIQAFEGLKMAQMLKNVAHLVETCYMTGNLFYTFLLFSTKSCNDIEVN